MNEKIQDVTLDRIKSLITSHPLFHALTNDEAEKLARLMVLKQFSRGETIVVEGAAVNSIYCIVEGTAEARRIEIHNNEQEIIPVAVLNPGEFIGLNESDFYSTTGKRTATVVAISDMKVLRVDLSAFHQFISFTPHFKDELRKSSEIFNRMNLIKRATFAKLSIDEIRLLAEQVTSLTISAGEIIFNKGDPGDNCYLIQEGKVEIFLPQEDGTEKQLAVLKSPDIFGEAAILMGTPRNASARAMKDCQLLTLSRDVLFDALKTKRPLKAGLLKIMKRRSAPKRLDNIEIHTQKASDQDNIITLKNPVTGDYYQLTEEGLFLWNLLSGELSIREITLAYYEKYEIFDPEMVANFIIDLEHAGFIAHTISKWRKELDFTSWWMKIFLNLRRVMEVSFSFGANDHWLTQSYNKFIHYFYTLYAQLIILTIGISGFVIFVAKFNTYVEIFRVTHYSSWLILFAFIASNITIVIHELAHAYTTKYAGRSVFDFGIGWFWYGPIAYCDTSDMWLSIKKNRLLVDLAGLYVDFCMGGLACLITLFITSPLMILFLWLIAFYHYLRVFLNLSPNIELDGYYTLMDLTEKENLREESITWLLKRAKKTFRQPALIKKYKAEIIYWGVCIIYLILEVIIPYIIMNFLLYGLFGTKNPYLSLIAPIIVITLSSLSIWAELKQKSVLEKQE